MAQLKFQISIRAGDEASYFHSPEINYVEQVCERNGERNKRISGSLDYLDNSDLGCNSLNKWYPKLYHPWYILTWFWVRFLNDSHQSKLRSLTQPNSMSCSYETLWGTSPSYVTDQVTKTRCTLTQLYSLFLTAVRHSSTLCSWPLWDIAPFSAPDRCET